MEPPGVEPSPITPRPPQSGPSAFDPVVDFTPPYSPTYVQRPPLPRLTCQNRLQKMVVFGFTPDPCNSAGRLPYFLRSRVSWFTDPWDEIWHIDIFVRDGAGVLWGLRAWLPLAEDKVSTFHAPPGD